MRTRSFRGLGPAFRGILVATSTTALGTQVTAVALPLLAVLVLHATPAEAGLLAAAQWLPFLLVALPLGVLVDRVRRRPLLIAAEWGRTAVLAVLVALAAAGVLGFAALLVLALLLGCCAVLYEVGYQSYLPTAVPLDRLDTANSRLQSTEAVALVGGPGLGGALVQLLGAAGALGVQIGTSAVAAVALMRIRATEAAPRPDGAGFLGSLRAGLAFLLRDRVLVGLVGFSAVYNPFEQWITVLFTLDAVRRLGLTPGQLGLLLSIGAGGAVLGAAVAPAVARRIGPLTVTLACAAIDPVVLLVLPFAEPGWGVPALILVLGTVLAVNAASTTLSSVVVVTVRQRRVPDALRGRVNAATRTVSYGSIALGALAGGLAGQLLGVRAGLALGCVGILSTIVWTWGWGLPLRRRGVDIEAPLPDRVEVRQGGREPS